MSNFKGLAELFGDYLEDNVEDKDKAKKNELIERLLSRSDESELAVETPFIQDKDILSIEEKITVIRGATNRIGSIFLSVLSDSGAKISELESLCINDVHFEDGFARINIGERMEPRWVCLSYSTPALLALLALHPHCYDSNSPLWVNIEVDGYGEKLNHDDFQNIVNDADENANVGKDVTPHLIRSSRIVDCANYFNDIEMCHRFG